MAGPETGGGGAEVALESKRTELTEKLSNIATAYVELHDKLGNLSSEESGKPNIVQLHTELETELSKIAAEHEELEKRDITPDTAEEIEKNSDKLIARLKAAREKLTDQLEPLRKNSVEDKKLDEKREALAKPFDELVEKAVALKGETDLRVDSADQSDLNALISKVRSHTARLRTKDEITEEEEKTQERLLQVAYNSGGGDIPLGFNRIERRVIQRTVGLLRGANNISDKIRGSIAKFSAEKTERTQDAINSLEAYRAYFQKLDAELNDEANIGKQREIYEREKEKIEETFKALEKIDPERFDEEYRAEQRAIAAALRERIARAPILGAMATDPKPINDKALQEAVISKLALLNESRIDLDTPPENLTEEQKEARKRYEQRLVFVRENVASTIVAQAEQQKSPRAKEYRDLLQKGKHQEVINIVLERLREGDVTIEDLKAFDQLVRRSITQELVRERTRDIEEKIDARIKQFKKNKAKNIITNVLTVAGGGFGGALLRNQLINMGVGAAAGHVAGWGAMNATRVLGGLAGVAAGVATGGLVGYISGDIRAKRETRQAGAILRDLEGDIVDPRNQQVRKLTAEEKSTILTDLLEGEQRSILGVEISRRWDVKEIKIDINEEAREAVLAVIREQYHIVATKELEAALAAIEADTDNVDAFKPTENLARALTALTLAHVNGSERIKRENITKYVVDGETRSVPGKKNPSISPHLVPGNYDTVREFIDAREKQVRETRRGAAVKGALVGGGLGGILGALFPAPTLVARVNAEAVAGAKLHVAANTLTEFAGKTGAEAYRFVENSGQAFNLKDAYTLLNQHSFDPEATRLAKTIIEHNLHIDLSTVTGKAGSIPGPELFSKLLAIANAAPNEEIGVRAMQHLLSHPAEVNGYILDSIREAAQQHMPGSEFTKFVLNGDPEAIAKSITGHYRNDLLFGKEWYQVDAFRKLSEHGWFGVHSPFGSEFKPLADVPVEHLIGFGLIALLSHAMANDGSFSKRLADVRVYEEKRREWWEATEQNEAPEVRQKAIQHRFNKHTFDDAKELGTAFEDQETVAAASADKQRWIRTVPTLVGQFIAKRDPSKSSGYTFYRLVPKSGPDNGSGYSEQSHNDGTAQDRTTGKLSPEMGLIAKGKIEVREYDPQDLFETRNDGGFQVMGIKDAEARWKPSSLTPNKWKKKAVSYEKITEIDPDTDDIVMMTIPPEQAAMYAYALANKLITDNTTPVDIRRIVLGKALDPTPDPTDTPDSGGDAPAPSDTDTPPTPVDDPPIPPTIPTDPDADAPVPSGAPDAPEAPLSDDELPIPEDGDSSAKEESVEDTETVLNIENNGGKEKTDLLVVGRDKPLESDQIPSVIITGISLPSVLRTVQLIETTSLPKEYSLQVVPLSELRTIREQINAVIAKDGPNKAIHQDDSRVLAGWIHVREQIPGDTGETTSTAKTEAEATTEQATETLTPIEATTIIKPNTRVKERNGGASVIIGAPIGGLASQLTYNHYENGLWLPPQSLYVLSREKLNTDPSSPTAGYDIVTENEAEKRARAETNTRLLTEQYPEDKFVAIESLEDLRPGAMLLSQAYPPTRLRVIGGLHTLAPAPFYRLATYTPDTGTWQYSQRVNLNEAEVAKYLVFSDDTLTENRAKRLAESIAETAAPEASTAKTTSTAETVTPEVTATPETAPKEALRPIESDTVIPPGSRVRFRKGSLEVMIANPFTNHPNEYAYNTIETEGSVMPPKEFRIYKREVLETAADDEQKGADIVEETDEQRQTRIERSTAYLAENYPKDQFIPLENFDDLAPGMVMLGTTSQQYYRVGSPVRTRTEGPRWVNTAKYTEDLGIWQYGGENNHLLETEINKVLVFNDEELQNRIAERKKTAPGPVAENETTGDNVDSGETKTTETLRPFEASTIVTGAKGKLHEPERYYRIGNKTPSGNYRYNILDRDGIWMPPVDATVFSGEVIIKELDEVVETAEQKQTETSENTAKLNARWPREQFVPIESLAELDAPGEVVLRRKDNGTLVKMVGVGVDRKKFNGDEVLYQLAEYDAQTGLWDYGSGRNRELLKEEYDILPSPNVLAERERNNRRANTEPTAEAEATTNTGETRRVESVNTETQAAAPARREPKTKAQLLRLYGDKIREAARTDSIFSEKEVVEPVAQAMDRGYTTEQLEDFAYALKNDREENPSEPINLTEVLDIADAIQAIDPNQDPKERLREAIETRSIPDLQIVAQRNNFENQARSMVEGFLQDRWRFSGRPYDLNIDYEDLMRDGAVNPEAVETVRQYLENKTERANKILMNIDLES
jgi:hypothetical protein